MSCKYKKVRTKNYQAYFYCIFFKKKITYDDCYDCDSKSYKQIKPIKGRKHRQTKATSIEKSVKEIVWERDNHRCIFCNIPVDVFNANAHFIPRSAGGLGIPENIFTACEKCHREQDNGLNTKEYDKIAEQHLKSIYGGRWNKEKLIYRKRRKLNGKQTRDIPK